ncbi:MAG TPA: Stk1 family PASTA domain-containing Ser/Thr kinase [Gaiellaceae bacterium]|jgi:serine/threonine-protein kinase|nr:Stk1 family PASTA domain-containing Ser/Thr kinase [Gaiellaceae bacterium]
MAVTDTLLNTIFDGRYKILRKLGAGGMADVYLAEDQELGRRVAIKILNDRHANDEQFVERFRREAKNAAGLSHPNIVSIFDRGQAENTYYIAMEYLDGRSLKELITARGPAPIHVAVDYARQILAALRVAHRQGVVHRDIKPHNVLVDSEGRIKVTDFGIARAGPSQMTEEGSIIGTAQYLSPEQAQGAPVTPSSDLYSVGIVLYELLTGTAPFAGETPVELAMKHLSKTPEPPSRLRPEVPRDLDFVVLRALAKSPDERYQSADEMDADLARVARGVSVSPETEEAATAIIARPITAATVVAPPVTPRPPPPVYYDYEESPDRRRSFWPWLLALGLLVAAGFAGWLAYDQIRKQLNASNVTVGRYIGERESVARDQLVRAGLKAHIVRRPSTAQPPTFVFDQDPSQGNKIPKGNSVTIFVSTGAAKVRVPDVRGDNSTDAAAAIASAGLKPDVHEVPSLKDPGTVVAQSPRPGVKVVKGAKVRINVSSGPAQVTVPPVVGIPFAQASSELQAQGFSVKRDDQDSNEPAGTVLHQDPAANTSAPKGSTVTLTASKGPTTTAVPEVTSLDVDTARTTLEQSGFKVKVVRQTTTDPSQENIVLDQDPPPNSQAKPGTTVTIFVGRFSVQTTSTTP